MAPVVKNPSANTGNIRDLGSIPGWGNSPGGGHGQPPRVFLPGKSYGQWNQAGNGPEGCKESDRSERLSTHALTPKQLPVVEQLQVIIPGATEIFTDQNIKVRMSLNIK